VLEAGKATEHLCGRDARWSGHASWDDDAPPEAVTAQLCPKPLHTLFMNRHAGIGD
jgi:hypothetical protein